MDDLEKLLESLKAELRRGTLVLSVLVALNEPEYGYALVQKLNDYHFEVEGNTLYPLLRRLEKQGLLKSVWKTDDGKPKKYYTLTSEGEFLRDALKGAWNETNQVMCDLMKGENNIER